MNQIYSYKNALEAVNSQLRLFGIDLSVNVQQILFESPKT
jgi:hypothetical protein